LTVLWAGTLTGAGSSAISPAEACGSTLIALDVGLVTATRLYTIT
jgi:hypothetical protein